MNIPGSDITESADTVSDDNIYADENGVLCLTDHGNMVGSATDYADQKKLQREKQNLLPENGVDNVHTVQRLL